MWESGWEVHRIYFGSGDFFAICPLFREKRYSPATLRPSLLLPQLYPQHHIRERTQGRRLQNREQLEEIGTFVNCGKSVPQKVSYEEIAFSKETAQPFFTLFPESFYLRVAGAITG